MKRVLSLFRKMPTLKKFLQKQKVGLVMKEEDFTRLRSYLLQADGLERAALVFLGSYRGRNFCELYVQKLFLPSDNSYQAQGPAQVELRPEFVLKTFAEFVTQKPAGLLHAHSHPFSSHPQFSHVDDFFLPRLSQSLSKYLCLVGKPQKFLCARLVLGSEENGFSADCFDENGEFVGHVEEIRVVGPAGIRWLSREPKALHRQELQRFDRNIRLLGEEAQRCLRELHLGVCGLGGLGFLFVAYAKGLGFRWFTLVDPDLVEASNLNRLLGATTKDIGKPKVVVAARELRRFSRDIKVTPVFGRGQDPQARAALLETDVLISCVDNDAARLELQVLAARHLKPLVDLGAGVIMKNGQVQELAGQVTLYFPGGPCLLCQGLNPANAVSEEILTLRRTFGYVQGEPAAETPTAVVTINAVLAGLSLDLLLRYLVGFAAVPSFLRVDLLHHRFTLLHFQKRQDCPICGKEGVEGMGEELVPTKKPSQKSLSLPLP